MRCSRRLVGMISAVASAWLMAFGAPSAGRAVPVSGRLPAGKAQAYYLYSLAQQARFEKDYPRTLEYLEQAIRSDDSADIHVELAEIHLSLDQLDRSEEQARLALALDPEHEDAAKILARLLLLPRPGDDAAAQHRVEEAESLYRTLLANGTHDEEIPLALAQILIDREDASGAAAVLETFRSAHPYSADIELQLGKLFRELGRTDESVVALKGLLKIDPTNLDALTTLGLILEEAGRHEELVDLYRRFVEQSPASPFGHYRLGTALLAAGHYPEAETQLITALKADSGNARILMALGQAYEATKRGGLAESAYRRALEREPESLEARLLLARVLQRRAEDDQALELYRQVQEKASTGSPSDRALVALASSQVGIIRFLRKDYPEAIRSLHQALDSDDQATPNLFGLLAQASLAANRAGEARESIAEGLRRFPGDPGLRAGEAEVLFHEGKESEARKTLRDLVGAAQESERGYTEVLEVLLRGKRFREAEPWMAEALRKYPDSKELIFQSAALQERLGRFREAEKRFRALIESDPENAEALNYLGYMMAERGENLQQALACLQRAVALDPGNAAFEDSLGWIYYRLEQYDEAEVHLQNAAKGSRMDPTVYDHLGDVRAKTGKTAEALEAYRTALQHGAENTREIRKKIRRLTPRPAGP
jgi:tetratricopeptide (TPR) repeat protein